MSPLQETLDEEREKGLQTGLQKGLLQGKQEGRMEGRMEQNKIVIAKMLKKNLQISVISEVTGLSRAQIKKLQNGSQRKR